MSALFPPANQVAFLLGLLAPLAQTNLNANVFSIAVSTFKLSNSKFYYFLKLLNFHGGENYKRATIVHVKLLLQIIFFEK